MYSNVPWIPMGSIHPPAPTIAISVPNMNGHWGRSATRWGWRCISARSFSGRFTSWSIGWNVGRQRLLAGWTANWADSAENVKKWLLLMCAKFWMNAHSFLANWHFVKGRKRYWSETVFWSDWAMKIKKFYLWKKCDIVLGQKSGKYTTRNTHYNKKRQIYLCTYMMIK